ncbi:malectin domain-containing carbohydrate-binding protein [Persicobacter sp. CCB-QB2]|uniref:malectin domain-containing carbohydrate-binding protein n=1 Tax=Persicobacter sp. CCB-QB2 TaxID=1561025 RepID=UPI0006A9F950|nr:malectin domain-containing carbohydrate-binding protein [Persicobacter sp. CCB-QB2]
MKETYFNQIFRKKSFLAVLVCMMMVASPGLWSSMAKADPVDIFECLPNIEVNNDAGQCGAIVHWEYPAEPDGVYWSSTHEPGSYFEVGTTKVTITAKENGNEASCSFYVTVKDNEKPKLKVPDNFTVYAGSGLDDGEVCYAKVMYEYKVSDNCEIAWTKVVKGNESGTIFPLGDTEVEILVCDVNGNRKSKSFIVTVKDGSKPVPAKEYLPVVEGYCKVEVTDIPKAFDNCDDLILGQTQDPLYYDQKGEYEISWYYADAAGNICEQKQTVIVKASPLAISIKKNQPSCYEGTNGSIKVIVEGGCEPYAYKWYYEGQEMVGEEGNYQGDLLAGTYKIKVWDAAGQMIMKTVELKQKDELVVKVVEVSNLECRNDDNGIAEVYVEGGKAPYNYAWYEIDGSQIEGETESRIETLSKGEYYVLVTDARGCNKVCYFTMINPPRLKVELATTDALCYGDANGMAAVKVTGGTGMYMVEWFDRNDRPIQSIGDKFSIMGLAAGDYKVVVTDAKDCKRTKRFTIGEPDLLELVQGQAYGASSYSKADGGFEVSAQGGTPPYLFKLEGGEYQDHGKFMGLKPGTYKVYVEDANGCEAYIECEVPVTGPKCLNACGGEYRSDAGIPFYADDHYVEGGRCYSREARIYNTQDPYLYQSERYGHFTYQIPVDNGAYEVELHFAEIYWDREGKRKFAVDIERENVLDCFDIYKEANEENHGQGGKNVAIVRKFTTEISDGYVNIRFYGGSCNRDYPKISAICIKPKETLPYNAAPKIVQMENKKIYVDDYVSYYVSAHDEEDHNLHYYATNLPYGLEIDEYTGQIHGTVASEAGYYEVEVSVKDDGYPSREAKMKFQIEVCITPEQWGKLCINANGRALIDEYGNEFKADDGSYFIGANRYNVSREIYGTDDDALYQTERWGEFYMELRDLPNGKYKVTIYCAEIYFREAGQRKFNIYANGEQKWYDYDPFYESYDKNGYGKDYANYDYFYCIVENGRLKLEFKRGRANYPKVSAICIEGVKYEYTDDNRTIADENLLNGFDQEEEAGVYPNPVVDQFTVKLENATSTLPAVKIVDGAGAVKVLATQQLKLKGKELKVNLGGDRFNSGVYLMEVSGQEGWKQVEKVMFK